jgi:diguanylate cyclase
MIDRFDFSALGRTRVVLWIIFGTIGCICVAFTMDAFTLANVTGSERLRSYLTDLAAPAVIAPPLLYYFANKLRELAIAHHKLAVLASTDSLTSVLNRGAFTTLVDAYLSEVPGASRPGGALLVIDVDHFKGINDSFGHERGDEALQLIARAIKGALRVGDLVGRMGGEEFGVFLPSTTPSRAELAAERIRQAIAEVEFCADGARRDLSVSVGGATFEGDAPFRELYRTADSQLYAAKESGRNRVAVTALYQGHSIIAA